MGAQCLWLPPSEFCLKLTEGTEDNCYGCPVPLVACPQVLPQINLRHWRQLLWVPNAFGCLPQSFASNWPKALKAIAVGAQCLWLPPTEFCLKLTQGTEGNCCGCPMPLVASHRVLPQINPRHWRQLLWVSNAFGCLPQSFASNWPKALKTIAVGAQCLWLPPTEFCL